VKLFRGIQFKFLVLLLLVGLLPLVVTSGLFYETARNIIVGDRVDIYLRHLSQQNADKIDLFLMERQEELVSMASTESVERFLSRGEGAERNEVTRILNALVKIHEVYDAMVLVDNAGEIRAVNTLNRFGDWFDGRILNDIEAMNISAFPEEEKAWRRALEGVAVVHEWYRSELANSLYYFEDDDVSRCHHLLFGQPVISRETGQVVGVWLNVMNWEFVQAMLDLVEFDFRRYGLDSGYALLLNRDATNILASAYRKNRLPGMTRNYIEVNPAENAQLRPLYEALQQGGNTIRYPMETIRYGGVARIGISEFGWILVVSLSEDDIFKPVQRLKYIFVSIILGVMLLITLGIWFLSRQLIRPILTLKDSALDIARGDYAQRVNISGSDELGVLAKAFNQMAGTVEERQRELEQINRDLETMVWDRTRALEQSNTELREAIDNLQNTQNQLIQSEKMASLGQLIAGIAHEIKNPLNFIYGNTEFLAEYVQKIRDYVDFAEQEIRNGAEGLARIRDYQRQQNLDFVMDDLKKLATNIHDGADRIRSIVNDLRSFSRASSGSPSAADIRKILDMCLNLLRNQYKNRIRIHREYADVDKIRVYIGKMEQVFLNLLTNAIQAIPEEGDIWVRVGDNGARLWVEIEDSGQGIPPEYVSRIFEPFFTTKDVGEGTGLGLSISYTIVQQHGGTMNAWNRAAGGAVFRVELPKVSEPPAGDEHV